MLLKELLENCSDDVLVSIATKKHRPDNNWLYPDSPVISTDAFTKLVSESYSKWLVLYTEYLDYDVVNIVTDEILGSDPFIHALIIKSEKIPVEKIFKIGHNIYISYNERKLKNKEDINMSIRTKLEINKEETLVKAKLIGKSFKAGFMRSVTDKRTLEGAAAVGIVQGLKYNGSLKNGIKSGVAVAGVTGVLNGVLTVAENWDLIKKAK